MAKKTIEQLEAAARAAEDFQEIIPDGLFYVTLYLYANLTTSQRSCHANTNPPHR